jgi:hypothetical protein
MFINIISEWEKPCEIQRKEGETSKEKNKCCIYHTKEHSICVL